jgi:hypothetical protein
VGHLDHATKVKKNMHPKEHKKMFGEILAKRGEN